MTNPHPKPGVPRPYRPTAREVDDLLARAAHHPLGTDFLAHGALDSVAATFGVHAFVVDAARTAVGAAKTEPTPAATGVARA